jgi:hypothetical protein
MAVPAPAAPDLAPYYTERLRIINKAQADLDSLQTALMNKLAEYKTQLRGFEQRRDERIAQLNGALPQLHSAGPQIRPPPIPAAREGPVSHLIGVMETSADTNLKCAGCERSFPQSYYRKLVSLPCGCKYHQECFAALLADSPTARQVVCKAHPDQHLFA